MEATLYEASSLKTKRSVVKSLTTRVKQRCNVSIAETDFQDLWQRTQWSLVSVGNERKQVETELQRALRLIESSSDLEVTKLEWGII